MAENVYENTSYSYFESIFDNSQQNCVLLMDIDGKIIKINPAFTNSFGYTQEELSGINASILYTHEDLEKGLFENELSKVKNTGQSTDNNYLVNKDKSLTWVSGESLLAKNDEGDLQIIKLIQNIHVRKVTEIALRNLNDFNESILSSIEDVVVVLDEHLNLIKANNAFLKLFKVHTQNVDNLNIGALIKPYDANKYLIIAIKNTIKTRKSFYNKQIEMNTLSGQSRIFDVSCKPLPNAPANGVLLIVHDITIHKQLEREREDIMGFVAHELRNPLSNVILCNEIMSEALASNELDVLKNMLDRTKNNVNRLQKMITELYEATIINSGYLKLDLSTFYIGEMIREAVITIETVQPSFQIIVNDFTDFEITADRHRLIQVITNFLSNGIKYSNGKTDIIINVSHEDDLVTVSVKDEGFGIPKNQIPFLFERFFRVQKTRNIEGIGLGLYLCQQIILAHKGAIWAESEEGKGSTFYFTIPKDFEKE
jgi:PAS domain S-box-containing protein